MLLPGHAVPVLGRSQGGTKTRVIRQNVLGFFFLAAWFACLLLVGSETVGCFICLLVQQCLSTLNLSYMLERLKSQFICLSTLNLSAYA